MSQKKKNKKIRTSFKQGYDERKRHNDLTREFGDQNFSDDRIESRERVSGKGRLARKRTVRGQEVESESGTEFVLEIDEENCLRGQVLSVHGLNSFVETDSGDVFQCATRKLLKTLSTDQRHVVVAGDRVWIRPNESAEKRAEIALSQESLAPDAQIAGEGLIVRIESRFGTISRASRNRRHVIAANIDQMFIVGSAAMPDLKPHLIDRLLVTAESSKIAPVICINKADLVNPASLQPLMGVFGQLGYPVWLTSAQTGLNVPAIRAMMKDKRSVVVGQSGVGKSSLLNAIQPGLALRVASVSQENQKGRHTTTSARLIKLEDGGYIVDTPGIRQFELWDVIAEEVAGYFRELRPFAEKCRFPNCSHTHEADCRVKDAVGDGDLDIRRYESYCQLVEDCQVSDRS